MDNLLFATVCLLGKSRKDRTVGGLSRVAQLRGSGPLRHSGAAPKSDRLATGITDQFALEPVIGLHRNG